MALVDNTNSTYQMFRYSERDFQRKVKRLFRGLWNIKRVDFIAFERWVETNTTKETK